MTIPGIDVSNNQGPIGWAQVAQSGVTFALCKVSEGTTFTDLYFAGHWAALRVNGMGRGAYHFARPSMNTAAAEATFFLSRLGPLSVGDVLALDLEDEQAQGDLTEWTLGWLGAVYAATGVRPLLYTSPGYLAAHLDQTNAKLADYGLWIASWQTATPPPPAPWPFWAVWQTSSNGSVPGISGPVDLDVFNGTIDQFRAYGLPQAPVKAPTNDDLVASVRYLMAEPPDMAGLAAYIAPFVGGSQ